MPQPERRYPESPLLKEIAHEMVALHGDLLDAVQPEAILFVETTDSKAKQEKIDSGEAKVFEIKELHLALAERLNADYMVLFHKLNAAEMDGAKVNALFLECLLRIKSDGGLRQPDVKTFEALAQNLGPTWKKRRSLLIDPRFNELISGAPRQAKLDLSGKTGELAERLAAELPLGTVVSVFHEVVHGGGKNTASADGANGAQPEGDWQPTEPLVKKDNVTPIRRTGTDSQGA